MVLVAMVLAKNAPVNGPGGQLVLAMHWRHASVNLEVVKERRAILFYLQ